MTVRPWLSAKMPAILNAASLESTSGQACAKPPLAPVDDDDFAAYPMLVKGYIGPGALAAGAGKRRVAQVVLEVERGVVDPARAPEAQRRLGELSIMAGPVPAQGPGIRMRMRRAMWRFRGSIRPRTWWI